MSFPSWQLHRGFWKEGVRENTMQAFRQAKLMGCEMVEMDVQLSRDGIPHVFHDYSLKRLFHVDQRLSRTSSEDLRGLNIPTLSEVLKSDEVPHFFNIEVKSVDLFCRGISHKICEVIKEYGGDKNILISSFNPMVLYWVKKNIPSLSRALIIADGPTLKSWKMPLSIKLAAPEFINCYYKLIDDEVCRERLTSFARPIMVWTVNDHEKALFYLKRGAKSIISDLPPRTK